MKHYLCLALERSQIRYKLVSTQFEIMDHGIVNTFIDDQDALFSTIRSIYLKYEGQVLGMTMTLPGRIDGQKGIAYSGGIYRFVQNMDYVSALQAYIPDVPIAICNDAKATALAEQKNGALKHQQEGILLLLLNTGIGGALVMNGQVRHGMHFGAGEFSFVYPSYHGQQAFFEMLSLDSLCEKMQHAYPQTKMNLMLAFSKLHQKEKKALKIFDEYCHCLAIFIFNLQCIIDTDTIVIGGDYAQDPTLFALIQQHVHHVFEHDRHQVIQEPILKECFFHARSRLYGSIYHFQEVYEGEQK